MNSVEIRNLSKSFGERTLYKDLTYSFKDKGLYAIVGVSGSGKSTLLEMISGLDPEYGGSLRVLGAEISSMDEAERSSFRLCRVGYIRQGYDLLELEDSLANATLPDEALTNDLPKARRRKGERLLSLMGIASKAGSRAKDLSGGEKQRVALARALSADTRILLADEPTGALDSKTADRIYGILKEISGRIPVIMVTHDEAKAWEIADCLLSLEDGRLVEKKPLDEKSRKKKGGALPHLAKKKNKPRVPLSFWARHAKKIAKARPWRSLLSSAVLTFSLIAVGSSYYLAADCDKEVRAAFASLVGEGSLVMESKSSGAPISRAISAGEEGVSLILASHPDLFSDYGVSYLAAFNTYFPDVNEAYVPNGANKIVIPNLDASSANDYVWLDPDSPINAYPSLPPSLEDDQIVLGLPYRQMAALCYGLHIERSYESLGKRLGQSPLELVFSVANASWSYEDEQLLSIFAVTESDVPTIYHYSHFWSTYFYEFKMRFPTSDEEDTSLPWIMQKVYYLIPSAERERVFDGLREDSAMDAYVLDPISYLYDKGVCEADKPCGSGRYYVYLADKSSIPQSEIGSIAERYGLNSYTVAGYASYVNIPSAFMSGFAYPFFASPSFSDLEEVNDAVSDVGEEEAALFPSLPSSVSMGTYKKPASSALTISNDFSDLKEGRPPEKDDEACISSALARKWGSVGVINVMGLAGEESSGGRVRRDYRYGTLRITGVVESSREVLYVRKFWSIDYFRDHLGVSAFSLEAASVDFAAEGRDISSLIASMSKDAPSCAFKDPSSSVGEGAESVLRYVRLALEIASLFSTVIAFLLLVSESSLTVKEIEGEGRSLFKLGLSRDDIASSFYMDVSRPLVSSLLSSCISMILIEYLTHRSIAGSFGSEAASFAFDPAPLGLMAGVALLAFLILLIGVRLFAGRHDFRS